MFTSSPSYRCHFSQIDFDLHNNNNWEYLFISSTKPGAGRGGDMYGSNQDPDNDHDSDVGGGPEKGQNDEVRPQSSQAVYRVFDCPPTWVTPLQVGLVD